MASLDLPAMPGGRFAHVVFPKAAARGRVINLAPVGACSPRCVKHDGRLSRETEDFFGWLFEQAGLDAHHYRTETLGRRLAACLRAIGAADVVQARRLLEEKPPLVEAALSQVLVGVSSFFRDAPVFEALERRFLPEMAQSRPGLYVWSAGCSNGAELYSVAILLAEAKLLGSSYLVGTDCRTDAIAMARRGAYDPACLMNVPLRRSAQYFEAEGNFARVVRPLRHATRWRTANVLTGPEPGYWDIILFRNTAIYLKAENTAPLWEQLERSLRPGGLLILGKAERPVGVRRLMPVAPCIYQRVRR